MTQSYKILIFNERFFYLNSSDEVRRRAGRVIFNFLRVRYEEAKDSDNVNDDLLGSEEDTSEVTVIEVS